MSASALMWASTHNDTLKEKMSMLVSNLSTCQEKLSTGYLSAFPSEFFDRFEDIKPVWAPYYTIHKVPLKVISENVTNVGLYIVGFKLVNFLADHGWPVRSIYCGWKLSCS